MPFQPRPHRPFVLAVAFAAHACGGDAPADGAPVTRVDSAGIEIVTTRIDASAPTCALQGEPVRIGSVDGDDGTALDGVFGALRLPDGRIAVGVDGGEIGVTLFSPEGEWLLHMGRRGQGPGELKDLWSLWLRAPDTLIVLDLRPARFHLFHADGSWVRTATLDPVVFERPEFAFPLSAGAGYLAATQPDGFPAPPDPADRTADVARHDESGTAVGTAGSFWVHRIVWLDPEMGLSGPPLFGGWAAMVPVAGDGFVYGPAREPQVESHAADGALRRIIRWEARDRAVRPADVDAYGAELRRRLADRGLESARIEEALRRETGDHRPVAEQFPGHGRMLATPGGRLWVEDYRRPLDEGPSPWFVFESDGTVVCRVNVPEGWIPRSVDADHLVATYRDDLDVEYVVVQPVAPPETGP